MVRVANVSETGFEAALFEEEANIEHGREIIGYVAIYSPATFNTINILDEDYSVNSSMRCRID